jgi:hypothetical protein
MTHPEDDPTAVEPDETPPKEKGRGHDPEKTTGQARAEEVHQRNLERQQAREDEPQEDLPDKPPIEDMPPEEGEEPPDEEESVAEGEFLTGEEADGDDTVDNTERPSTP